MRKRSRSKPLQFPRPATEGFFFVPEGPQLADLGHPAARL
jgi:hypothetical protein